MEIKEFKRGCRFKGNKTAKGVFVLAKKSLEKSSSILDIGAGDGYLVKYLKGQFPDKAIVGIDPNPQSNIVKSGDIANIDYPDASFDLVVCTDVIEHLPDKILDPGLHEIARVLTKGGRAIFTTLLKEDLSRKTERCPKCGEAFHPVGHIQSFTEKELITRLKKAGLMTTSTKNLHLITFSYSPLFYSFFSLFSFAYPEEIKKLLKKDIAIFCEKR